MITVSLVEDDDDYRNLVGRALRSDKQLRLLSAYATAEEALQRFPREKPDVALVAIKLPGLDGIECIRRLLARHPALPTRFVILAATEDAGLIFDALRAGARGYLLKSQTPRKKLIAALKEVFAGGVPITPIIARELIGHFEVQRNPEAQLSDKEEAVLLHLANGLMYKEIADQLSIPLNTVRKRVGKIYEKLHVHTRAGAMDFARNRHSSP